MMLPNARRPSITPRSSAPRSCCNKMISAASLATSTAPSTEMPTSEVCSDGASLMPSPKRWNEQVWQLESKLPQWVNPSQPARIYVNDESRKASIVSPDYRNITDIKPGLKPVRHCYVWTMPPMDSRRRSNEWARAELVGSKNRAAHCRVIPSSTTTRTPRSVGLSLNKARPG